MNAIIGWALMSNFADLDTLSLSGDRPNVKEVLIAVPSKYDAFFEICLNFSKKIKHVITNKID